jgi:hypothetical protein
MVKCFFLYTHANETQEFNGKMNIVLVNLKTNMGMNVKGLGLSMNGFFHSFNVWMRKINYIQYMFLIIKLPL